LRGNLFVYQMPSQALLLPATTGGHPTLINPASSGKVFIPTALRLSYISGTITVGSVVLAETLNVGGGAATGAPILTATLVAGKSARRGAGAQSTMQWSPSANTFTAAPTVLSGTDINVSVVTAEVSASTMFFDGSLVFEPGTALSICYTVTTSTALFFATLWGVELAYPTLN
jgi:hypothetical protein